MTELFTKLIMGNCLEGLRGIEDESIDLVVTSPPYNINLKSRNNYTHNYFDNLDELEYRENIKKVINEFIRITHPIGSIWINMKSRWMDEDLNVVSPLKGSLEPPTWILDFTRGRLFLKNLIIWNYDINSDTKNNKFHPRYEFFFWFVKHPRNYFFNVDRIRVPPKTRDKRNNPLGANPTDVWYFPLVKGNSKERNNHPAQYPEAMIERIILSCSNAGDIVLDPFFGSGTTGVVALRLKRNFIGFEIEEEYFKSAINRIKKEIDKSCLPVRVLVERLDSKDNVRQNPDFIGELSP
ncbi:MAG: DNA-methyltransferase [Promethearchaeota archaeon]